MLFVSDILVIFGKLTDVFCCEFSFWDCGPTFYSNDGWSTSRIDYIVLPIVLRNSVVKCEVWTRSGDALQLINIASRRDHRPVVALLPLVAINMLGAWGLSEQTGRVSPYGGRNK